MAYSKSFPIPQNMLDTIDNCTLGLGAVGVVGGAIGPGADTIVILPTWIGMTVILDKQAGSALEEQTAKKLCMAVLTGVGGFVAGMKIASTLAGWLLALPTAGLSIAANAAVNAGLNATLTRAFGRGLAKYFLQTHRIENSDIAVKVLIALVGLELGIPTSHSDIVA